MLRAGLAALTLAVAAGAQDPSWPDFEVTPPGGWTRVDAAGEQEILAGEFGNGPAGPHRLLAAFEKPTAPDGSFADIAIWQLPYSALPSKARRAWETVTVDEIAKMVTSETVRTEMKSRLEDTDVEGITDIDVQPPVTNFMDGRITIDSTVSLANGGVIRARSRMHVGTDAMVRLDFSAPADEWEGFSEIRLAFFNSFRFAEGKGYDPGDRRSSATAEGCGRTIGTIAVPAAILTAVIWFARRRNRARTVPGPASPKEFLG